MLMCVIIQTALLDLIFHVKKFFHVDINVSDVKEKQNVPHVSFLIAKDLVIYLTKMVIVTVTSASLKVWLRPQFFYYHVITMFITIV